MLLDLLEILRLFSRLDLVYYIAYLTNQKKVRTIMEEAEKPKKLEEYKQDKEPVKPFIVSNLATKETRNPYSNSIDFYDAIPKYWWGNQKRDAYGRLSFSVLEREFIYRDNLYRVFIQPAKIKMKNGLYKECLPSQREELVEDALRKIASEGSGVFLDDSAGVTFTLYELEQELKQMGHHYHKGEIKEAIMICGKTNMEVQTKDGKSIVMMPLFETVGLQTQEDWKGYGKKTKAFVRFNSLVTKSIKEKSFRLVNYTKSMSYQKVLARWFHKRLSHNYRQASLTEPFTITLNRIINDSGIKRYNSMRYHIRELKEAFEEMKAKEELSDYKIEKKCNGRKIEDAKFILIPHESFVNEMKFFNHHHTEIRSQEIKEEAFAEMRKYGIIIPASLEENKTK